MRLIDDAERRARLARRHALGAPHRVGDVDDAVRAIVALHATEAATPFLSINARVDARSRDEMARSLYESRSIVKQLAMRRTVFVFPRDLLVPVLSAPASRVAGQGKAALVKDLRQIGIAGDAEAWLDTASVAVMDVLAGGRERSAEELREGLAELSGKVSRYEHKSYGAVQHIAPRVISWMGANGDVVRGRNASHWRVNRILWARMDEWIGGSLDRMDEAAAYAALVERYLRAFGPVTEIDLVWWFGATKSAMRQAIAALGAVEVRLERNGTGWVLPDDVAPEPPVESWAAVLPALDPTALGWKQREFYLHPDFVPAIFDRTGNCGTTAWWNGEIVGAYVQDDAGRVELVIGRDPGPVGRSALESEAARLGLWLDGERVNAAYKSPIIGRDGTTWSDHGVSRIGMPEERSPVSSESQRRSRSE